MRGSVRLRDVSKYYKVIMTRKRYREKTTFIDKLRLIFLGSTFSERRSVKVIRALDKVSLNIDGGEVFGVLGKNGSGKTTLLLILGTVVFPDEGEIRIYDMDYYEEMDEIRKIIVPLFGWMRGVRSNLTARQNIELELMFHDIDPSRVEREIEIFSKEFEIYDRLDDRLERFSSGMIIKVALIPSFIILSKYDKALMLCDEPFVGLDVIMLSKIREILRKYSSKDFTLILASHQTKDLEALCDRVAIIDKGRILTVDTIANLKKKIIGKEKIIIEYISRKSINIDKMKEFDEVLAVYKESGIPILPKNIPIQIPMQIQISVKKGVKRIVIISRDSRITIPNIIDFLMKSNVKIQYLKVEEPGLDEVLTELTRGDKD